MGVIGHIITIIALFLGALLIIDLGLYLKDKFTAPKSLAECFETPAEYERYKRHHHKIVTTFRVKPEAMPVVRKFEQKERDVHG